MRIAGSMTNQNQSGQSSSDIKLPILNAGDYSGQDENIEHQMGKRDLQLNKFGQHLNFGSKSSQGNVEDEFGSLDSQMDNIERSRILAHSNVVDSHKYQLKQQRGELKQKQELIDMEQTEHRSTDSTGLKSLSCKWFLQEMLEKHARSNIK